MKTFYSSDDLVREIECLKFDRIESPVDDSDQDKDYCPTSESSSDSENNDESKMKAKRKINTKYRPIQGPVLKERNFVLSHIKVTATKSAEEKVRIFINFCFIICLFYGFFV